MGSQGKGLILFDAMFHSQHLFFRIHAFCRFSQFPQTRNSRDHQFNLKSFEFLTLKTPCRANNPNAKTFLFACTPRFFSVRTASDLTGLFPHLIVGCWRRVLAVRPGREDRRAAR